MGDRDAVILKAIRTPDMGEFDEIVSRARSAAKRAGLKKQDVAKTVKAVRARK